jgi:hypothetical protein
LGQSYKRNCPQSGPDYLLGARQREKQGTVIYLYIFYAKNAFAASLLKGTSTAASGLGRTIVFNLQSQ